MVNFCRKFVIFLVTDCNHEIPVEDFLNTIKPVWNGIFSGLNFIFFGGFYQFEGEGKLKMDNGITFLPNDRYLLENEKFRLYYTAEGEEAHNFIVVVEDNFGNSFELEFDFNNRNVKDDGLTIVPISNFRPLLK